MPVYVMDAMAVIVARVEADNEKAALDYLSMTLGEGIALVDGVDGPVEIASVASLIDVRDDEANMRAFVEGMEIPMMAYIKGEPGEKCPACKEPFDNQYNECWCREGGFVGESDLERLAAVKEQS
jgi:hypothetical protein